MAGIQQHKIGVIFILRANIALIFQQLGHARCIVNVHLTAIGLHQNLADWRRRGRGPFLGSHLSIHNRLINVRGSWTYWGLRLAI